MGEPLPGPFGKLVVRGDSELEDGNPNGGTLSASENPRLVLVYDAAGALISATVSST